MRSDHGACAGWPAVGLGNGAPVTEGGHACPIDTVRVRGLAGSFLARPTTPRRHLTPERRRRRHAAATTNRRPGRRGCGDGGESVTSADDALVQRARSGSAAFRRWSIPGSIDATASRGRSANGADARCDPDALVCVAKYRPRRDGLRQLVNRIVANSALMARRHRVRLRGCPSVRPTRERKLAAGTAAGPPCPDADGRDG
jgi:hypothetical protein